MFKTKLRVQCCMLVNAAAQEVNQEDKYEFEVGPGQQSDHQLKKHESKTK